MKGDICFLGSVLCLQLCALGCSFHPVVDPRTIHCTDDNGCPSGYRCVVPDEKLPGFCCDRSQDAACSAPRSSAASDASTPGDTPSGDGVPNADLHNADDDGPGSTPDAPIADGQSDASSTTADLAADLGAQLFDLASEAGNGCSAATEIPCASCAAADPHDLKRTIAIHGNVQWTSSTHLVVTYDWACDAQMQDWASTLGATLRRNADKTVTILPGQGQVHAMRWRLPIAASRIYAVATPQTSYNHINIYTNLAPSWNGESWDPSPALGVVHANRSPVTDFWLVSGNPFPLPGPLLTSYDWYEFEFLLSPTLLRTKCSSDNIWNELAGTYQIHADGIVALGAFGGQSSWAKVVIEGDVSP